MVLLKRWPAIMVAVLALVVGMVLLLQSSVMAQATGGTQTGGAETGGASVEAEAEGKAAEETGAEAGSGEEAAAGENPFAGDEEAVAAGQALYTGALGCYGCHGREGGGGMGPNISDANWIYGGDDASLFETLKNGRPNGMPAFGAAATDEQLWQVVSFVQSLSQ